MSETVAFRLPSEMKESWEQTVKESPEYDSLTHLIKLSVRRELAGGSNESTPTPSIDGDERLGEIAQTVSQVDTRLSEVVTIVEEVRERSHSVGGGIDQDILTEVFKALDLGGEGEAHKETYEIAEEANVDKATAEMALEKLREEMPGSVKMDNPGENITIWWRAE